MALTADRLDDRLFARLCELLDYEPETGLFRWKVDRGRLAKAGQIAGTPNHRGHIRIRIDGTKYPAGRIAWRFSRGEWPTASLDIDHKDTDPANNRPSNLRLATRRQNCQNRNKPKSNKSGFKNVHWDRQVGKWRAGLQVEGKYKPIGHFDDAEAAGLAVADAAVKYRGEFARC